jgi:hypothetical protein
VVSDPAALTSNEGVGVMKTNNVDEALLTALKRGYLVVEETPTVPASPALERLFDDFNTRCEELGRHRVMVCLSAWGLWRTMIVFGSGPDAELDYVREEISRTFVVYLGSEPRRDDPQAWYGSTSDKSLAEALAAALVAVDCQPRDAALNTVLEVHAL